MSYFLLETSFDGYSIKDFDYLGRDLGSPAGLKNEHFYGYKIAIERSNLSQSLLGSYIEIKSDEQGIQIKSDYPGREPVFYAELKRTLYASNSFEILLRRLKQLDGWAALVNEPLMLLQAYPHQATAQATSDETLIRGIYLLKINECLFWDTVSKKLSKKSTIGENLSNVSYENIVTRACEEIAHSIHAIVASKGFFILSLSGGRDSRALLAATRYVLGARFNEHCFVRSSTAAEHGDDLTVVTCLADEFGFQLNRDLPIKREWSALSTNDALIRWVLGNSALYYNWGPRPSLFSDTNVVSLRGGQANPVGEYGDLYHLAPKISSTVNLPSDYIVSHFKDSAGASHADSGTEVFDKHYVYWRYRIHYGRQWGQLFDWALHVDPMANSKLDEASFFRLSQHQRYSGVLKRDVILAFDPHCLNIRFSSKGSIFDAEFVRQSTFHPFGLGVFERTECTGTFYQSYKAAERTSKSKIPDEFEFQCIEYMREQIHRKKFLEYFDEISKGSSVFHECMRASTGKALDKNQFSKAFLLSTVLG